MDEPDWRLVNPNVDRALTGIEALADQWAVEVDLPAIVNNLVGPMRLSRDAPDKVRENFIDRMKQNVDAMIKQAFIEGAFRGCTGAFDAVRAGYDPNTRTVG